MDHLTSLVDDKTVAILVNNPSNPCGSNYTKEHLLDLLKVADRFKLPIISDEIYENMVHASQTFYPLGSLTENVPVLTVSGLSKVYMVPGWRLGWVLLYDKLGLLEQVRIGITKLTQLILGPNTLVQSIVPFALFHTPKEFFLEVNRKLEEQSVYLYETLSKVPGLRPVRSYGSMYTMVGLDLDHFIDIKDDIDFCQKLLAEECVSFLPATIFRKENYFRIVVCPPVEVLKVACQRMTDFCIRHSKPSAQ